MNRRIPLILTFLCIILGLGMTLYPLVSTMYMDSHQSQVAADLDMTISELEHAELEQMLADAQNYNRQLLWSQSYSDNGYFDLLNLSSDGCMGYISIPTIDVKIPIFHGVDDEALAKGAGHLPASSLPVGGSGTHTVISAHTGMAGNRLFTDLERLKPGDHFFIHTLGSVLCYEVRRQEVVLPSRIESLKIIPGRDQATLVTCTPYAVNSHRLLVHAVRVELPVSEEAPTEEQEQTPVTSLWMDKYLQSIAAGVIVFVLLLSSAGIFCIYRRKRHEKTNR